MVLDEGARHAKILARQIDQQQHWFLHFHFQSRVLDFSVLDSSIEKDLSSHGLIHGDTTFQFNQDSTDRLHTVRHNVNVVFTLPLSS